MKVNVGQEPKADEIIEPKESDELPGGDGGDQPIIDETPNDQTERIRQLEIEKARLEGEVKGRTASAPVAIDTTKQLQAQVWADVNGMDDENFRTKYKYEKHQATAALLQDDLQKTKTANSQQIAELRAENRLASKYGKDFYEVKGEVDEMLSMASAEVRQDPEKLAIYLEKAYQAVRKDKPVDSDKKKVETVNRSRINSGFEKPTPTPSGGKSKEDEKDDIAPEYRQIGRAFGITSEKERKQLASSDIIPIEFGNGIVFRDPEKGFEKISAA